MIISFDMFYKYALCAPGGARVRTLRLLVVARVGGDSSQIGLGLEPPRLLLRDRLSGSHQREAPVRLYFTFPFLGIKHSRVVPRVGRQPHQEGWHAGRARRDDAEFWIYFRVVAVAARLDRFRTHLPLFLYSSLKLLPAGALLPVACVDIKCRAPHAIDAIKSLVDFRTARRRSIYLEEVER
jgi:hypothetical protein